MEYAVSLAIIAASLLAMTIYMKRGYSGRLRAAADSIGEQYDPRHTTSTMTLTMKSDTTTTSKLIQDQRIQTPTGAIEADVIQTTTTINNGQDAQTKSGTETVEKIGTNLWE